MSRLLRNLNHELFASHSRLWRRANAKVGSRTDKRQDPDQQQRLWSKTRMQINSDTNVDQIPLLMLLNAISEWVSVRLSHAVKLSLFAIPTNPRPDYSIQTSNPDTPMTKTKKVEAPTLYTPSNVCPTISPPHMAPISCSLSAIQFLNSSMVMLALASFNSMLPGW